MTKKIENNPAKKIENIRNIVIEKKINRKVNYKFNCLLAMCLLLIIGLTGCSKVNENLTVSVMPDLSSIPIIVAKEQGYFKDNIKIEIYKSAPDRDSALYSGNLDGSVSDVLAACLAQDGDFPVYITSRTDGRYGIVADSSSGITSPKMLEGKEIGLSLNTVIEYVTDSMVTADGGDASLVKKTSVPKIPSRLELLQNNQIDSVAMPEPYVTAAGDSGETVVGISDELGINPGVILFTKDATENKTNEIKEFYEAYDKAVDFINSTDVSEFMPAVIKELGLPDSALEVELPKYEKTALPEEGQVMEAMNWLLDKGLIKNEYTYNDLVKEIK
jgi:NitT/TauT family transport system substrate-binding protein